MRWDGFFANLDAQAEAMSAAERDAEIQDRTRSEVGRLGLVDRLGGAIGSQLRLSCLGDLTITGHLARLHPEWLLIVEGGDREAMVALSGVLAVGNLGPLSAAPGTMSVVDSRLGFALALRGIARDRSAVKLHLADGSVLDGTLDRVGADFVELAEHPAGEARRRSTVRQQWVVATRAVVALRRGG